jgi:hypothetical protein
MDGINSAEWQTLLKSANSGELYLDPETGKGLDKVCDDHLDKLQDALQVTRGLRLVAGFGNFNSGKILQKKFSDLAQGTDRSMDAVLKQHIDAVNIAKQVVAKAIANYVALDEEHRKQIERLTPS